MPTASEASSSAVPVHRDPSIVERNRTRAHSLGIPDDALVLDGRWDFRFWTGEPPDDDFFEPSFDRSAFDAVQVPGSWMLQGGDEQRFGIPIYTNVQYPFDTGDYPNVPLPDEGGDHVLDVTVPTAWDGRRVVLRLGAAESSCEVWVNGHAVGYSTDSRLPAEFDVTEFVKLVRPQSSQCESIGGGGDVDRGSGHVVDGRSPSNRPPLRHPASANRRRRLRNAGIR